MRAPILTSIALLAVGALAQAPAPLISAYYSADGGKTSVYRWMAVDSPLTVKVDPTGRPHLGLPLTPGLGLFMATSPAGTTISVDSSYVAFRSVPPKQSGSCMDAGTGVWAVDATYFYFCAPDSQQGFRWGRVAMETGW